MTVALEFAPSAELSLQLAEIDVQRRAIDMAKGRAPDLWVRVLQKVKLSWTTDSNAIEGSTLSFGETKFFIENRLMNLLLLRDGYPPAVVPLSSRRRYYETLAAANQGDLTGFIDFMVACVQETQAQILSDLEA
jgi:hypothetical protein